MKTLKEGIVLKSTGSRYIVTDTEGNTFHCVIKGKFRIDGYKTTNPVAVGDHVFFRESQGSSEYLITKIRERKNYIIRKSSNLSKQYHIIAANIDLALLIVTLKFPETQSEFIDRYLITAEAYSIPAILVFNKIDIYEEVHLKKMEQFISVYSQIGYPCVSLSAKLGTNIEELKSILKNKTSLFSGNSGVGKSSIINVVDKNIKLKTNDISSYKHNLGFLLLYFKLSQNGKAYHYFCRDAQINRWWLYY